MIAFLIQNRRWLLPLFLFLAITPFTPYLDLKVSSFFYDSQIGSFPHSQFYRFVFDYAQFPALFAAALATVVFTLSYFKKSWIKYRDPCLLLILAIIIGPGLIINVLLKPSWGRPRPRQIEELGGTNSFRPFYDPDIGHHLSDKFRSMPSGHASMGFYFFALAILGTRLNSRKMKISGYCLALGLGALLGLARIAQGGHFLSDVIISALITWWIALVLDWMLFDERFNKKTV